MAIEEVGAEIRCHSDDRVESETARKIRKHRLGSKLSLSAVYFFMLTGVGLDLVMVPHALIVCLVLSIVSIWAMCYHGNRLTKLLVD